VKRRSIRSYAATLRANAAVLLTVCWAALGTAPAVAASDPPSAASASAYREIEWGELVPKDWKPPRLPRTLGLVGDASVEAQNALADMRAAWDAAPTVASMDGALVKIPGYVVPLEKVRGELKELLLVPYFGACIHMPPPPANQIVFVRPVVPPTGFRVMDTVWVSGKLSTTRQDSYMGASGYRLVAVSVERYLPK
jgi:hypothetical protein